MRVLLVPNFQLEYSVQLINSLSSLVDVTILVWKALDQIQLDLIGDQVELVGFDGPRGTLPARLWNQLAVHRYAKRHTADVVHYQNAYIWGAPLVWLHSYKRAVTTIHDPYPHPGLADPLSFPAIALHLRAMDALVVLGRAQKEAFLSRFRVSPEKVVVIPHGEFSYFKRFATVPESDDRTVLFLGRIVKYKGLEYLLRAVSLVVAHVPDARFRIVGLGDLGPYRSLLDSPHVDVDNRFVSPAEVAREVGRAALVVVPYTEASQSGIVTVAQSLGRPVVASAVGGLPDEIMDGETGLLVQPRDPVALAGAIADLLQNPARRAEMGRRAYEFMKRERSWDRIARQTYELYQAIQ